MNENCLCVLVVTKTAKVSVSGVGLGLDHAGLGLGLGLPGLGLGLGLSGLGLGLPGLDNISAMKQTSVRKIRLSDASVEYQDPDVSLSLPKVAIVPTNS